MSRTPVSMCAVLGRRVLWGAAVVMNPGWSRHSRAASGKFRMFGRDNPRVVNHWMGHTRSVGEPGAPERRRWRMALAGPVVGVAGAVVLLAALGFSRFMASSTDELVATFALQLTLTAVACVLWLDPRQRSSAVLVGLAVVAISASVMNSEEAARRIGAYWPMVGWAAEWWAVVPLLVVLLRYPEARIRDRLSRAIVVAATAVFVVWRVALRMVLGSRLRHPRVPGPDAVADPAGNPHQDVERRGGTRRNRRQPGPDGTWSWSSWSGGFARRPDSAGTPCERCRLPGWPWLSRSVSGSRSVPAGRCRCPGTMSCAS